MNDETRTDGVHIDRGEATDVSSIAEVSGQVIGRYKLLQQIGEGGCGVVYMAEQEKPIRRKVALKIVKPGMDTRQVIARFEGERQALAMMDHPHIAKVLDAGATETGRSYFVMELVRGEPITHYCDRQSLSVEERLHLFQQTCSAVQHAHQKGIIHRDIKPSNVLVTLQDGEPVPKVIDFGIAKAMASPLIDRTAFTHMGQFVGTPGYMSPEQAASSGIDIDTRSDVYSLGVLLYELLTGTTPLDSTTMRGAGLVDLQRIIRDEEPPRPSARLVALAERRGQLASEPPSKVVTVALGDAPPAGGGSISLGLDEIARQRRTDPRSLCRRLRGDLDWIVMKALEKDRSRRYESASGFATDIHRHLTDDPVEAGPPSPSYRLRKFVRRYRWQLAANAAIAALTIAGLIGTSSALIWALREKDRAERETYHAQILAADGAVGEQRMGAGRALLDDTPEQLRGWEHRHLTSRLERSLPSPLPVGWDVNGIRAPAGAAQVLVRRVKEDGAREWVALGRDWRPEGLVLPDTHLIAMAHDGGRVLWSPTETEDRDQVTLFDTRGGDAIASWVSPRPGARPDWLEWNSSGDRFLIGYGTFFDLHDARTGELLRRVDIQGLPCFVAHDRFLLLEEAGGDRYTRRLLDARTMEPTSELRTSDTAGVPVLRAIRGSRIAVGTDFGNLHLLEVVDNQLRERWTERHDVAQINTLAWSPDGRQLAAGDIHGKIRVMDADTGRVLAEFAGEVPLGLWFLPESGDLLVADFDAHDRVLPIASASSNVLTAHRSYVYPGVLFEDGAMLVTGGWDGAEGHAGGFKVWDARTGALVGEYGRPGEVFYSVDIAPSGRHAVAGVVITESSHTEVIDLFTGEVHKGPRCPIASRPERTIVHPDGRRVLSTCRSGETRVWDLLSGDVLWQTDQHIPEEEFRWWLNSHGAAAISPDGRLIALADGERSIRLIDTVTYEDVRRWYAHQDFIWSLSFTPDGSWVLSTSDDGTVGVWDVATGRAIARLVGHDADVLCAAMSPDGTRIASGGRDGYVRLWDTTHFENVAQLAGHTGYIYALTWSPDGEQLISTSGDSTVRIWETRTLAEQVAAVRARKEALPGVEEQVARAWHAARDPAAAIEALIASTDLDARRRELVRQVVAGYALDGGAPAYYRAPRASGSIVIDGRIDESEWGAAPWTASFADIEGPDRPTPRFGTRARMQWDDKHLYVAAHLDEPHVWGTLIEHDSVIYRDNDFEVFVDPDGDGLRYGEVEVNALGTIFDLLLDRPYRDGGRPDVAWSPADLRVGVSIDGTLNDPSDEDRGWSVEMAIPHAALAEHTRAVMPPRPGDVWRINFSRVQWQHEIVEGRYVKRPGTREDNWTWTPQHVIDMHHPRRWGFVEFVP